MTNIRAPPSIFIHLPVTESEAGRRDGARESAAGAPRNFAEARGPSGVAGGIAEPFGTEGSVTGAPCNFAEVAGAAVGTKTPDLSINSGG